jgi:putative ABC transport system permease protein
VTVRRRNVPIPLLLLLRRLKSPEGRLAPLAAFSIAVSVALATGLEMSSRSAQVQLESTALAMAGAAKIEVTAGKVGVDESVLEQVRAVPGVLAASPLISAKLGLRDQQFAIDVIGVDFLAEDQVRPASISRRGIRVRDPLRLLSNPGAIVVTQSLLDRVGLSERWVRGETCEISVRADGALKTLSVQGVLEPVGIAEAFGGQVALMDVYALQAIAGRAGLFDRVDIVPAPDASVPELIDLIGRRLDGTATARRSSARAGAIDEAIDVIRRGTLLMAGAGALAAYLLVYATTSRWVDRQRRQLATLRAVGMEASRVQRGILLDVCVLGVVGSIFGILGGIGLSPWLLAALSTLMMNARAERLTSLSFKPSTIAMAFLIGIVGSLTGSVVPAIRAGRRFTLDALDDEPARSEGLTAWLVALTSASIVLALSWSVSLTAFEGAALVRVIVMFVSGLAIAFSLTPLLLGAVRSLLNPLKNRAPHLGHLVAKSFVARPSAFAITTTAITCLIAAMAAGFLLLQTTSVAIEDWTASRFPDATLISAGSLVDVGRRELLLPSTIDAIRATEGVVAVDEQYREVASVLYRGREVRLNAHDMAVVAQYGHIASVSRPSRELAEELSRGNIAVSTMFARNFAVSVGDSLELDTAAGKRSFRIVGLVEDFVGPVGSILLDLKTFDAHWHRTGAWSTAIWTSGSRAETIERIRVRVGDVQDLYFSDAKALAASNRAQNNLFTGVFHAIAWFVASLGGVGVAILLVDSVAERRRDFALLRAAGAAPSTLVILIFVDAAVVALCASASGLTLGIVCASPMTDVLRDAYGWTLRQQWFAPELPFLLLGALLAALAGACAPARMAYRAVPCDVFAPE